MTNQAKITVVAEDKATQVFRQVSGSVGTLQRSFERVQLPVASLQGLLASLTGGAVIAGFRALVGAIDDLDEAAQGIGIAATSLANLRQGALEAGVNAEQLDTALTRLNVRVSEAADGNEEAARLFRALGVAVRDAGGEARPADQVLKDLAGRFSSLQDGTDKARLAVELFGRSGAELIPFLNQGADGLERFSGLTSDTVREAARLQAEVDKLSASWSRLKFQIAGAVIPAINEFIELAPRLNSNAFLPAQLNLLNLGRQYLVLKAQKQELDKQIQLGIDNYGNEGRALSTSAREVFSRVEADKAATAAAKKRAEELARLNKELEAQRRAQQQGDSQRDLLRLQRIDDAQAAVDQAAARRAEILRDLTGQTALAEQAEQLRLIDEALFDRVITLEQYDVAYRKVFGLNSDAQKGLEKTRELADQVALSFASSLGQFIEKGGSVRDFFDALAKDLLKITTQLLIVEPLARALRDALSSGGGGSGFDLGSLLASFAGARAMGGPVAAGSTYLVGERGPELFTAQRSGYISPNGAVSVVNNFTVSGPVDARTQEQIAAAAARGVARVSRRYN